MTATNEAVEENVQAANGLEMQCQQTGEILQVALIGRLDTLSAPELLKLLDERSETDGFRELVFDLAQLEYLSSTGLRIILMMAKRLGGDHLFVDNANPFVREIFETTGFTDVVTVR